MFDVDIIIVCDGINTNHFDVLYVVEKTFYEVAANKTCSTCYKNCLALRFMLYSTIKTPSLPLFRGMVRRGAEDLDPLDPPV